MGSPGTSRWSSSTLAIKVVLFLKLISWKGLDDFVHAISERKVAKLDSRVVGSIPSQYELNQISIRAIKRGTWKHRAWSLSLGGSWILFTSIVESRWIPLTKSWWFEAKLWWGHDHGGTDHGKLEVFSKQTREKPLISRLTRFCNRTRITGTECSLPDTEPKPQHYTADFYRYQLNQWCHRRCQ